MQQYLVRTSSHLSFLQWSTELGRYLQRHYHTGTRGGALACRMDSQRSQPILLGHLFPRRALASRG